MNIELYTQEVLSGDADALIVLAELKQHEKHLKECMAQVEKVAMDEARKYIEGSIKSFEYKGYKIEVRNGGFSYKFDHIKEWSDKKDELKEIEAKALAAMKARSLNLNTVTDDGEVLDLPIATPRKDSIVFKPIKN